MTDIEGNPISYSRIPTSSSTNAQQATSIENPYAENPRMQRTMADRILNYVKRIFYITLSSYVLHQFFRFYSAIFQSPLIIHEWLKVGVALTVGTFFNCKNQSSIWFRHGIVLLTSLCSFFVSFETAVSTAWNKSLC